MMLRGNQAVLAPLLLGAVVVAGSALHGAWAEQQGDCEHLGVTVVYEGPSELAMACAAAADVHAYFQRIGFEVSPKISLRYVDRSSDSSADRLSAHGYYDKSKSQIVFYRQSDAKSWGQPWSHPLAASFLRHELAHTAIWEVVKQGPARLPPEWHEFITYAIQLDLMDPQLRQEVLAAHADVGPSENLLAINEFSSRMDPDWFAVMAYKTYLARGAETFVAQLLRAEFVPPPFSYPFAALPGQVPTQ